MRSMASSGTAAVNRASAARPKGVGHLVEQAPAMTAPAVSGGDREGPQLDHPSVAHRPRMGDTDRIGRRAGGVGQREDLALLVPVGRIGRRPCPAEKLCQHVASGPGGDRSQQQRR